MGQWEKQNRARPRKHQRFSGRVRVDIAFMAYGSPYGSQPFVDGIYILTVPFNPP